MVFAVWVDMTDVDSPRTSYDPHKDDLPRVQIPLGQDAAGLTINGDFYPVPFLPDRAQRAYKRYVDSQGSGIGETKVHMCDKCAGRLESGVGYLTTSTNVGDYRNPYTCNANLEERQAITGAQTVAYDAPEAWELNLQLDGGDTAPLYTTPDRTLTVAKMESNKFDADRLAETTVELPDSEATITGETDGDLWKVTVEYVDGDAKFVHIDWTRLTEDGTSVTYTDDEGNQQELADTQRVYPNTYECHSKSFTRIWPPGKVIDKENIVNVYELDGDDVPNSKSHLSRIQNECTDSVTRDWMMKEVAQAVQDAERQGNWPPEGFSSFSR